VNPTRDISVIYCLRERGLEKLPRSFGVPRTLEESGIGGNGGADRGMRRGAAVASRPGRETRHGHGVQPAQEKPSGDCDDALRGRGVQAPDGCARTDGYH
jgi:hypothetical protein